MDQPTVTTGSADLVVERLARLETAGIYERRTVADLGRRVHSIELRMMKSATARPQQSLDASGWTKIALALVLPIGAAIGAMLVTGDAQRAAEAARMFSVP